MQKKHRLRWLVAVIVVLLVVFVMLLVWAITVRNDSKEAGGASDSEPVELEIGVTEISEQTKADLKDDTSEIPDKAEGEVPEAEGENSPEALPENTQDTETAGLAGAGFYKQGLTEQMKKNITGVSFPSDTASAQITYEELSYVHVLYYDFNNEVQEGELICNQAIAQDLVEIFEELYEQKYQIEKIRLIDAYGGDDDASMADNNTSCFNYRPVPGTDHLSQHSFGLAIDINPLYNPYVTTRNGKTVISPEAGSAYVERSKEFSHKIDTQDLCYQLFTAHGFTWGGSWKNSKDYQHFQKSLE